MAITLGQAAPIKHSRGPARGGRPGPLTSKASTLLPHHFCQVPDWWKNSVFSGHRGEGPMGWDVVSTMVIFRPFTPKDILYPFSHLILRHHENERWPFCPQRDSLP